MKNTSIVVLAAGAGTRMKSARPKVVHKVNGLPMLSYLLRSLEELLVEHQVVIVGYKKEEVIALLADDIEWVEQKIQQGTGHALQIALQGSTKLKDTILVLCGDIPLLTATTLRDLLQTHQASENAITILSAELDNPFSYGRIVRDANNQVIRIVEEKDASSSERMIKEINSGIYCFKKSVLEECIELITPDNKQNEYYLTDVVEICRRRGGRIDAVIVAKSSEIIGINTLKDLAWASKEINRQVINRWLDNGVTIIDPDDTYIDCRVRIGKDTTIYPLTHLEGETVIGESCQLGPASRISDCQLGDQVAVSFSVLAGVKVENNCSVAPFSHVWSKSKTKKTTVFDPTMITPLKPQDQLVVSTCTELGKTP